MVSAGRRRRAGSTPWPHSSLCVLVAEKKPPRAQRMEGLGLCLCVVKLALAGVKGVHNSGGRSVASRPLCSQGWGWHWLGVVVGGRVTDMLES